MVTPLFRVPFGQAVAVTVPSDRSIHALRSTTEDEKGSSLPDRSRPYSAIGCPLGAQS